VRCGIVSTPQDGTNKSARHPRGRWRVEVQGTHLIRLGLVRFSGDGDRVALLLNAGRG
jgi:hypothetical protein